MRCLIVEIALALVWICAPGFSSEFAQVVPIRPTPDEALSMLKAGNQRFTAERTIHPHTDFSRLKQAGTEDQGKHAYATVLACSDSRVPVERIFDAGIMDLFVVRVAGNVCNTDEAGSIEYGLAHVNTPVLVIMGHSQCGAVKAVTAALQGKGHSLERNIPPMVASIGPAVKRVMQGPEGVNGANLIELGVEENVWQSIENLFLASPSTRQLVNEDKIKVVGAIYDVGTGQVKWLPESKVYRMLGRAEVDPRRATNAFADEHETAHAAPIIETPTHAVAIADEKHAPAEAGHGAAPAADEHAKAAHGDEHALAKDAHAPHGEAPADEHGKKPAAGESEHSAKDEHGAGEKDKAAHADDSHKSEDEHGEAASGDEHADAHGEEAASASAKPWTLIGAAGGIAFAGIILLVLGMRSKSAPAVATAEEGGAPAPAPAQAH
jgi:carbonic anhydrase